MKVLHIANWYPSSPTPFSALWIQNHINSLSEYAYNKVYHIEIRLGKANIVRGENEDKSSYFIIYLPKMYWTLNELISFLLILIVIKKKYKDFDIVNFHIAYPNCTYLNLIRKWIKIPMVITEHWSAYHFNFNIINPQKRKRIKRIFKHNIPIITVSKALLKDIEDFSNSSFPNYIIPNIVNTEIFTYLKNIQSSEKYRFFSVSQWKWPKNPFTILKAWKKLQNKYDNLELIIGGYGPQWNEMIEFSNILGIQDTVEFRGRLNSEQIALEMNKAIAFIHLSEYETFSVVCAEALCCGTPVIASNVGGIREIIKQKNGILIDNKEQQVIAAIKYLIENEKLYKKRNIFTDAVSIYSKANIGKKYYETIQEISRIQ